MALDVHIGNQLDDASVTMPLFTIGSQMHSAFFRSDLSNGCPLLQRMDDYYSDCSFAGAEIPQLLSEIEIVCKRIPSASPYQSWMDNLRMACETAMSKKRAVFLLFD